MTRFPMHAMGTDCLLIVNGPEGDARVREALARAAGRVSEYEDRYSRFRAESELTRLNEAIQIYDTEAEALAAAK